MIESRKVHWREIRGNPFAQALHPAMLSESGYTVKKLVKLNDGEKHSAKQPVEICYQRDYAIAWLVTSLFAKLQPRDWEAFLYLLRQAKEEWLYPSKE